MGSEKTTQRERDEGEICKLAEEITDHLQGGHLARPHVAALARKALALAADVDALNRGCCESQERESALATRLKEVEAERDALAKEVEIAWADCDEECGACARCFDRAWSRALAAEKERDATRSELRNANETYLHQLNRIDAAESALREAREALESVQEFLEDRFGNKTGDDWSDTEAGDLGDAIDEVLAALSKPESARTTPDGGLNAAWALIANAHGGNWDKADPQWRAAAEKWRDQYEGRAMEELKSAAPAESAQPGTRAEDERIAELEAFLRRHGQHDMFSMRDTESGKGYGYKCPDCDLCRLLGETRTRAQQLFPSQPAPSEPPSPEKREPVCGHDPIPGGVEPHVRCELAPGHGGDRHSTKDGGVWWPSAPSPDSEKEGR